MTIEITTPLELTSKPGRPKLAENEKGKPIPLTEEEQKLVDTLGNTPELAALPDREKLKMVRAALRKQAREKLKEAELEASLDSLWEASGQDEAELAINGMLFDKSLG